MSEQAIETDENEGFEIIEGPEDEAVVNDTDESETKTTETKAEESEDGEVEIVLEGEEEPTSKPAPRGVRRLVNRLDAAKAETDVERHKREALEEENKLLRLKLQQDVETKEPNIDDFETDSEYQTAIKDFYKREATKAGAAEAQRIVAESQQQTTRARNTQTRSGELDEHYARADTSGIKGYDELEGAVIDVLGQELVEELAANNEKAHLVIAHLGVNLGKAERFAREAKTRPVKALLDIGALANSLTVKRKHSPAASPETTINKGTASTDQGSMAGVKIY